MYFGFVIVLHIIIIYIPPPHMQNLAVSGTHTNPPHATTLVSGIPTPVCILLSIKASKGFCGWSIETGFTSINWVPDQLTGYQLINKLCMLDSRGIPLTSKLHTTVRKTPISTVVLHLEPHGSLKATGFSRGYRLNWRSRWPHRCRGTRKWNVRRKKTEVLRE